MILQISETKNGAVVARDQLGSIAASGSRRMPSLTFYILGSIRYSFLHYGNFYNQTSGFWNDRFQIF